MQCEILIDGVVAGVAESAERAQRLCEVLEAAGGDVSWREVGQHTLHAGRGGLRVVRRSSAPPPAPAAQELEIAVRRTPAKLTVIKGGRSEPRR
jgi:hypothetical protein